MFFYFKKKNVFIYTVYKNSSKKYFEYLMNKKLFLNNNIINKNLKVLKSTKSCIILT
jgi:hypothetical protein